MARRKRTRGNRQGDPWPRYHPETGKLVGYEGPRWISGKRYTRRGKTKTIVRERLDALEREIEESGTSYAAKDETVAAYLDRWLQDTVKPSATPNTYKSYEASVRLHISPVIGAIKLKDLRSPDIRRLYVQKQSEGKSRGSIETMRIALRSALSQAYRDKLIPENPCSGVKIPTTNEDADEQGMHPLDANEVRRLLDAARGDRFELAIILGVNLGLRAGEVFGLKWDDFDLTNRTVKIRRQLQRNRDGSGGYSFPPPKRGSTRTLDIPGPVVAAIESYRDRLKRDGVIPAGLIFTTKTGKPVDPDGMVKRHFKPLLERAELPDISFHDLRHTCATLHISSGTDIKTVQMLMGHKTAGITLDTYSHYVPAKGREAADRMAAILG